MTPPPPVRLATLVQFILMRPSDLGSAGHFYFVDDQAVDADTRKMIGACNGLFVGEDPPDEDGYLVALEPALEALRAAGHAVLQTGTARADVPPGWHVTRVSTVWVY